MLGVLNYCWISPTVAFTVIDHKGEQFMPFTLFDGRGCATKRYGRSQIQVVTLLGQLRFNRILSGFNVTRD